MVKSPFAPTLDKVFRVATRVYRWAWGSIWAALILGAMVIALTVVQFTELLATIHPDLVWVVLGVVGVLLAWALWRCYCYARVPRIVSPPSVPPAENGWTVSQQRAYTAFAIKWLKRQSSNTHLSKAVRDKIPKSLESIRAPLAEAARKDPIRAAHALTSRVESALEDVVSPLDQEANRLIQHAAVEVAIATAISPSALMDSIITMTRNIELISRLAGLYYGRPGFGGTVRIVRDVFGTAIVAGVSQDISNHIASAVTEMTGSWTTRFLGPAGQGILNGLLTIRVGAAAQQRCRSITARKVPWSIWRAADYRQAAGRLFAWISDAFGPSSSQALSGLAAFAVNAGQGIRRGGGGPAADPVFNSELLNSNWKK